jgi:hypothetical protein
MHHAGDTGQFIALKTKSITLFFGEKKKLKSRTQQLFLVGLTVKKKYRAISMLIVHYGIWKATSVFCNFVRYGAIAK